MLELVAQDAEHLAILRARLPLVDDRAAARGGRVVGDLALVSAGSGRRFGAADLAAAQELADRCGLYLENARLYRELERARDELEAILAGVADAVTVQEPDGRLVYVNDAAVRLLGSCSASRPRGAARGAAAPSSRPASRCSARTARPFPIERCPGRLALSGEEPEPVIIRYRGARHGRDRAGRASRRGRCARRTARVTHAINVIEDITDLKQAEETPAAARRGRPRARRLARLRGDAAARRLARGARAGRLVHGRRRRRARASSASPSPTPTRRAPSSRAAMQGLVIDPTGDDRARGGRAHRARRAAPAGRRGAPARRRAQPGAPAS